MSQSKPWRLALLAVLMYRGGNGSYPTTLNILTSIKMLPTGQTLPFLPCRQSTGVEACVPKQSNHLPLRILCWLIALTLGTLQAWITRFRMNPDGISYLDLGDAFWRGDWHNAINAYWSPLYAVLLGFVMKVFRPSCYWEYPVVHAVNLLIYAATLGCFDFLLSTLVCAMRNSQDGRQGATIRIPEPALWMIGYTVFISSSLLMIGLGLVAPDMAVAGLVYLASALALRIRNGAKAHTCAWFGLILGIAYLSKAVMFVVASLFFAAVLYKNISVTSLKKSFIAILFFAGISVPFIAVLSVAKHHFTFGEVGPIAYEVYVDGVDQFVPEETGILHPVHRVLDRPPIFEFEAPIAGTYPLWYDPTYWHAGAKPHFEIRGQLRAIGLALLLYTWIPLTYQLNLATPLVMLLLISTSAWVCYKRAASEYALTVPAVGALLLYSLVYAESRYLAPFFAILWLAAFAGLEFESSSMIKKVTTSVAVAMLLAQCAIYARLLPMNYGPIYFEAADRLRTLGVVRGDKLAVFAGEPFGETAFAARLARARIVIQSRDAQRRWVTDPAASATVIESLRRHTVRAALWYGEPPAGSVIPWQQIGSTRYYAYILDHRDTRP